MNEKLEQLLVAYKNYLKRKPSGNKKAWRKEGQVIGRQITEEFMSVRDLRYAEDFQSRKNQIEFGDWQ